MRTIALALLAVACARPQMQKPLREQPFVVTMWCGPPLDEFDDARADEIARAGFNVVGPPCEGETDARRNLRALDVARRHGLRLFLADFRFGGATHRDPDWKNYIDAAAADYRGHPALAGYFVEDEPNARDFAALAETVERLAAADPEHPAYINLRPDYDQRDVPYREYLERFLSTVHPRLFSFDHYPFLDSGDRPSFTDNLSAVREAALEHRTPFWLIVQAMPHGPYRDPTAAELRWQVFHALAYGAAGVSYFAYWTPVHVEGAAEWKFRHRIIDNGRPTEHYDEVAAINRQAVAIAAALRGFRSVGIGDARVQSVSGAVTVGRFARHGAGAALVVNRSYRESATVKVAGSLVSLAPGDARLFQWIE